MDMHIIVRLIVGVIFAVAIKRHCDTHNKNVILGLGIFFTLFAVMIFTIKIAIFPGTISAFITYGILHFVPQQDSLATTGGLSPATTNASAPAVGNGERACPGCKSAVKADAVRCLECGRSLAGI